jgi:hypothetical protein
MCLNCRTAKCIREGIQVHLLDVRVALRDEPAGEEDFLKLKSANFNLCGCIYLMLHLLIRIDWGLFGLPENLI